jgi:hypothetical protein
MGFNLTALMARYMLEIRPMKTENDIARTTISADTPKH